jgi:hypothetical protein
MSRSAVFFFFFLLLGLRPFDLLRFHFLHLRGLPELLLPTGGNT